MPSGRGAQVEFPIALTGGGKVHMSIFVESKVSESCEESVI